MTLTEACRLDALAGGPLLVAVSGGGDSMALLHALRFGGVLPEDEGRELVVAHADHGLRPESLNDRAFVESVCEAFGLRCIAERLVVKPSPGEGLEAAARRMRYEFLATAAGMIGARVILLAHTLDDQAETVLHRLCRGTGIGGLSGMPSVREVVEGIVVVRPLLGIPRSALRSYLASVGQTWVEDASNADTSRTRNHLRHEILPRLVEGPYPDAIEAICRLAEHARRNAALVRRTAAAIMQSRVRLDPTGVVVELAGWQTSEQAFLPEIFVEIWELQGWPRRGMTAEDYGMLADVARRLCSGATREVGRPIMLPGGVRMVHEPAPPPGRLVLRRQTIPSRAREETDSRKTARGG